MPIITANPSRPRRQSKSAIYVPLDTTVTPPYAGAVAGGINPGELVYVTPNNGLASLATTGASGANAAQCCGVSNDAYPIQYGAGITAGPPPYDQFGGVIYHGVIEDGDHLFNATPGDTYKPYQPVYVSATSQDGRTIQAAANGTAIGIVSPDQRQATTATSAPLYVFGTAAPASGQLLYITIKPALSK